MKMKSFAALAMSGLLAASFAYVAPAMADDMSNSNGMSSMPAPSDNGMPNSGNPTETSPSSMNNVGSSDEGTPDTATGDDDY